MAEILIWTPSNAEGLVESDTLRIMKRPMKWHGYDRRHAEVLAENGNRRVYKEAGGLTWNGVGCDRVWVPTMYYMVAGEQIVARAEPGRGWRAFLKDAEAWIARAS